MALLIQDYNTLAEEMSIPVISELNEIIEGSFPWLNSSGIYTFNARGVYGFHLTGILRETIKSSCRQKIPIIRNYVYRNDKRTCKEKSFCYQKVSVIIVPVK